MASSKNVVAWLLLMSVIALHVVEEAGTGFLPFYNNIVSELRLRCGFFPLPTFSFQLWLGILAVAIIAGFALTRAVYRGGKIIRVVFTAVGLFMILNACAHLAGSLYFGKILPGFWSSPVLLVAAIIVVARGFADANWKYFRKQAPPGLP